MSETSNTTTIDWKGKVILIAEDEVFNYKLIEKTLRKTGAKIIWADNGKEVVKLCEDTSNKIDLILMDIKMPVMNGFEASEKIKEIRSDILSSCKRHTPHCFKMIIHSANSMVISQNR